MQLVWSVNLFMLPDEPELFRQCIDNISLVRAACRMLRHALMIEPLVMLPNEVRGGYQVDGDAEKIVTSGAPWRRRWAPTSLRPTRLRTPRTFTASLKPPGFPCWFAVGARKTLQTVFDESLRRCIAQGAIGMVYGRNIYQHDNPGAVVACADGDDPQRRQGDAAWDVYNRG